MRPKSAAAEVIARLASEFSYALKHAVHMHATGDDPQAIVAKLASAQEIIGAILVEMRVQGLHDPVDGVQTLASMQARLEAAERALLAPTGGGKSAT
jgi:hypothetical protein